MFPGHDARCTVLMVTVSSAATPIFAAVVALLNNERAQAGKPPLGFLNPWLYAEGFQGLTECVFTFMLRRLSVDGLTMVKYPAGKKPRLFRQKFGWPGSPRDPRCRF